MKREHRPIEGKAICRGGCGWWWYGDDDKEVPSSMYYILSIHASQIV
jgi:hypothetical protein